MAPAPGILDELGSLLEERRGIVRLAPESQRPTLELEAVDAIRAMCEEAKAAVPPLFVPAPVPTIPAEQFGELGTSRDTLRAALSAKGIRAYPSVVTLVLFHDGKAWACCDLSIPRPRREDYSVVRLVPAGEWAEPMRTHEADPVRADRRIGNMDNLHALACRDLATGDHYVIDARERMTVRARVAE